MKNRFQSTGRLVTGTLLLALAVAVLAGLAIASPGRGGAAAAQYAYPSGKAYGLHKITICHKGHTIRIAAPAWKAHSKHAGDHLGAC